MRRVVAEEIKMNVIRQSQSFNQIWNKFCKMSISLIFICLILFMNIQKVIAINGVKINISLGDVFLIPGMLVLLFLVIKHGWKSIFPNLLNYVLLVVIITLSSYVAHHNTAIISKGFAGYLSEIIKTMTCICYFYLGYNVLKIHNNMWFIRLYALGVTFFIGYGLIANWAIANNLYKGFFDPKHMSFFIGTYKDPNQAATFMIMSIYVLFLGIKVEVSKWTKIWYILLCGLSIFATILTDSRGGVISLITSLGLYLMMNGWKRKNYIIIGLLFLVSLLLITLLLDMYLTSGNITSRLFSSINSFGEGIGIRKELARVALQIGNENPFIGIGRGNFSLNSDKYMLDKFYFIKNLVPHTTYLGLYAEVGILGTILYATPVYLIGKIITTKLIKVKGWYELNRSYLNIVVAMALGLAIQAMVLNLENRRTIWFLLGWIMITLLDGQYLMLHEHKSDKLNSGKESRLLAIMIMITIALYGISAYNITYTQKWNYEEGYYQYELPMGSGQTNQLYTLEYKVHAHQKDLKGNTIEISIIEEFEGGIYLLNRQVYQQVSGTAKLEFRKKKEESKVYITAKKMSTHLINYRIQPVRYYNDNNSIRLDKIYALAPKMFRNRLVLLHPEEDRNKDMYANNLMNYKKIQYEDEIILQSIEVKEKGEDNYINIVYSCKKKLDIDYTIWLYGVPDNMHLISENKWKWSRNYFDASQRIKTSQWEPNRAYVVTFKIPKNDVWYSMITGIYKIVGDKKIKLLDNATGKTYVELGWFKADRR